MNNRFSDNKTAGLVCNDCGTRLPSDFRFCTGCGGRNLSPEPVPQKPESFGGMKCSVCGAVSPAGCRFCVGCGAPLNADAEITRMNRQSTPSVNPQQAPAMAPPSAAGANKVNRQEYSGKKSGSVVMPLVISLVALLLIAGAAVGVIFFGDELGITPAKDGETAPSSYQDDEDYQEDQEDDGSSEPGEVIHYLPYDVAWDYYEGWDVSRNTFGTIAVSSYADWSGTRCVPTDAYDGNIYSAWQDGRSEEGDYGIGDWLLVYNSDASPESISSVTVYNGYQSTTYNTDSKDFYYLNSRVKGFTLEFDDGSTESFTLSDTKSAQKFSFSPRETCFVRFTIDSVYEGDAYSDTCIGELIYN